MYELIKKIFIPNEIVVNGTIISFDFDNFQINMIKISNIEFSELYFSYGDFGNIAGSMLKKYGLIFKDNGLFINYEKKDILLTDNIYEFCRFINIDIDQWKSIKTRIDLFELIISCKFYKKEIFKNANNGKKNTSRPAYIEFLNYICIDVENTTEYKFIIDKKIFFDESIIYFDKQNEINSINEQNEKNKIIKSKFNGNMIKERGYTNDKIGIIINEFKNKYINFDNWIYISSQEEINKSLDEVMSSFNI
jgi:hypothetical protein